MVQVHASSAIVLGKLPSLLRWTLRTARICRRRRFAVASGALVLPAFHGASRKIDDEEPEQGDEEEPQDHYEKLPDLRRQDHPLRRVGAPAQGAGRVSYIRHSRLTRNRASCSYRSQKGGSKTLGAHIFVYSGHSI